MPPYNPHLSRGLSTARSDFPHYFRLPCFPSWRRWCRLCPVSPWHLHTSFKSQDKFTCALFVYLFVYLAAIVSFVRFAPSRCANLRYMHIAPPPSRQPNIARPTILGLSGCLPHDPMPDQHRQAPSAEDVATKGLKESASAQTWRKGATDDGIHFGYRVPRWDRSRRF